MSAFRNFAISFTIISVLAGCLTSFYLAFQWGGPVAVTWGWVIVGCFTTFVALSMAEIASTYPTAGGLYYWSSKLGSAGWGWFTGWFNLIGLIGIIGAVGYGLAIYATSLFNLWWGYSNDLHHIFYMFALALLGAALVNVFDVRITSFINGVSAWWHIAGVLIIIGACIFVPDHHQSFGYVFGQTLNNSGFSGHGWGSVTFFMVFAIGSIGMAQYTLTGYDASAHMSEETHKASRSAATGMLMSVVVSVIAGFALLVAITFAIPDQTKVQTQFTYITEYIWQASMGRHWAETLIFIVVAAQFYCLTACVTSGSRMLFAFSRDRAVPGHQAWRKVSKHRVPIWSVIAVAGAGFLRRHLGRHDRPLHRLHPARDPALPAGRQVREGRLEPRQALQVDQPDRDRLGGADLDHLHAADRARGDSRKQGRLHLGCCELRTAHDRRRVPPVWRLVGAVGQQVVQGPRAHGNGDRARRARGEAGGRVPASRRHRVRRRIDGSQEGRRKAPLLL
jgi:amino acid transporter